MSHHLFLAYCSAGISSLYHFLLHTHLPFAFGTVLKHKTYM